ncbi:MAG: twin-arginine translocation signal domain-containing protein [Betaproteobacteria bacterium]|nr:twin-arginine translocation signal domain-containing protein [Betaproteobacteria bacterium]
MISRRKFLQDVTLAGAAGLLGLGRDVAVLLLGACPSLG